MRIFSYAITIKVDEYKVCCRNEWNGWFEN
jgi:hypothetical protein